MRTQLYCWVCNSVWKSVGLLRYVSAPATDISKKSGGRVFEPHQTRWGSVTQLVEFPAVNRDVTGSSPVRSVDSRSVIRQSRWTLNPPIPVRIWSGESGMWGNGLSLRASNSLMWVQLPPCLYGIIAQLGEHQTLNLKVAGSFPVGLTGEL